MVKGTLKLDQSSGFQLIELKKGTLFLPDYLPFNDFFASYHQGFLI